MGLPPAPIFFVCAPFTLWNQQSFRRRWAWSRGPHSARFRRSQILKCSLMRARWWWGLHQPANIFREEKNNLQFYGADLCRQDTDLRDDSKAFCHIVVPNSERALAVLGLPRSHSPGRHQCHNVKRKHKATAVRSFRRICTISRNVRNYAFSSGTSSVFRPGYKKNKTCWKPPIRLAW